MQLNPPPVFIDHIPRFLSSLNLILFSLFYLLFLQFLLLGLNLSDAVLMPLLLLQLVYPHLL